MRVVKWLFGLWLVSNSLLAAELAPFSTDGCSSFPDGNFTHKTLWRECCIAHDYAYWKGGSFQERVRADRELKECVAGLGEDEIAVIMLVGVRVGGSPNFPTDFRWGYGWPYPRPYKSLTEGELKQIQEMENSIDELGVLKTKLESN